MSRPPTVSEMDGVDVLFSFPHTRILHPYIRVVLRDGQPFVNFYGTTLCGNVWLNLRQADNIWKFIKSDCWNISCHGYAGVRLTKLDEDDYCLRDVNYKPLQEFFTLSDGTSKVLLCSKDFGKTAFTDRFGQAIDLLQATSIDQYDLEQSALPLVLAMLIKRLDGKEASFDQYSLSWASHPVFYNKHLIAKIYNNLCLTLGKQPNQASISSSKPLVFNLLGDPKHPLWHYKHLPILKYIAFSYYDYLDKTSQI